ncbi:MAG: glycosyltransferase family 4 protein [Balneolaceae bacterium]|nr:glycosyltransferase family 4 protein [Balneolaceae bacterium]
MSHTHPDEADLNKNIGGMQRVSFQLVRELERRESVKVIAEVASVSENFNKLQTIAFLLKIAVLLPLKVRKTDADLVLFSSITTAIPVWFLRSRISVPMIAISHGRDVIRPNRIYQQLVHKAFQSLDGVISISKATQNECIKRGLDSAKGIVLPNGIDLEKFSSPFTKEEAFQELKKLLVIPTSDKKILLTVGRLVKRKGHEWFVRNVMPKIKSDIIYVIIGDGPERNRIAKVIEEEGLEGQVALMGYQTDKILRKAYAAADVFVMPNIPVRGDMEGFGIVLLEANLAGTLVVASDLEGIKDVIIHGKNGFKVQKLNAEKFARKIDQSLNTDLQKFSEDVKSMVEEKFAWRSIVEQYLSFFKKFL